MSVSKMKTISISGIYDSIDQVTEACAFSDCFHPEMTADLVNGIYGFSRVNDENPYASRLQQLTDVLRDCGIEPEMTEYDESASQEEMNEFLTYLHDQLIVTGQRRNELQEELQRDCTAIAQLEHFETLNVPLDRVLDCEFIKVRFGRLPIESYQKLKGYDDNPYILFVPCSVEGSYYWGIYVAPEDNIEEADRIFASLFFERLDIVGNSGTPAEALAALRDNAAHTEGKIKKLDRIISEYFEKEHDHCMGLYTYLKHRSDVFELRRYCAKYRNSFMLVGWVPEESVAKICSALKDIKGIDVTVGDPENMKKATPPSRLKNKRIFRPFEMYVSMYGLPGYGETDPTAFVAVTYTVLFGIMFADLGQGILLSLIGYLMYRIKKMALGKILVPCGISAAFFGLCTGSVFGFEHLLDPMFRAMGFDGKPIDVLESSTTLLGAAIGIGVVLLFAAMGMNIVSSLRRRDYASAIFGPNGFTGMILYASVLCLCANLLFTVPVPTVIPVTALIIAVVLVFLREPLGALIAGKRFKPESVSDFCIETGAEMFEILLSYVTNTISFLRVGAFMLVHAGMMQVFFSIADMMSGAGAAVMIIFGNIFVMALEGLLVGIQVLRLEFYEMFSRFYNGDGREYHPITSAIRRT